MSINGGIKSLEEAKAHLQHMDGVMVGREAYQNPGILAAVDREIFVFGYRCRSSGGSGRVRTSA